VLQTDHPQNVLIVEKESDDGKLWLDREIAGQDRTPVSANAIEELDTSAPANAPNDQAALPAWRLKTERKIILVPYFQAGANGGGVRTMFPTRDKPF
jgi:hypothetical protein